MPSLRNALSSLVGLAASSTFVVLLVLLFTGIPMRIAQRLGVPDDWAFALNWSVPLILLLLIAAWVYGVMAVERVTRWIGQDHRG